MFFDELFRHGNRSAVIEGEQALSYRSLQERCQQFIELLPEQRSLCLLKGDNSINTLVAYLSCLQQRYPMLLVESNSSLSSIDKLVEAYRPNVLIDGGQAHSLTATTVDMDSRLALLLSTSGSTGSPKQVALSYDNMQSNAESICRYLPIQNTDITITTLPFCYSYGLSIVNTHLLVGASIVMNESSIVSREFWEKYSSSKVTSFGGVPYIYEMLLKLRFFTKNHQNLRYITQAGGKLDSESVQNIALWADQNDCQFFVMYGQTEATARMAYLEPSKLMNKSSSIGQHIPGGAFFLRGETGSVISTPNTQGELFYQGNNIMLGYAQTFEDLAAFSPRLELATGDLAYFDEDGDYYISGRKKRFIKIQGRRISLDDVERRLFENKLTSMVAGKDNQLNVAVLNELDVKKASQIIRLELGVHPSLFSILVVDEFPVTANQKPDYVSLQECFH